MTTDDKGSLHGRIAAVTGGGSGIGEAISLRLAAEGARVAVLDVQLEPAKLTAALAGNAVAVQCDVSDSSSVEHAFAEIDDLLGPVDILVNNAGVKGHENIDRIAPRLARQEEERTRGPLTTPLDALVRLTDAEWRTMLAVHLDGTFFCSRAAAQRMSGGGTIVNVASICGLEGCTGHPHYSAAKAGILGFTRAAAKELIVQGIRMNAVAPGFVAMDRSDGMKDAVAAITARVPAGRLALPAEIAATVLFLAGDESGYFVGDTLSPNGGYVTR